MADLRFQNTSSFIPAINLAGIRTRAIPELEIPDLPGAACKGVVTSPDDDLFFPEQVKGGRKRAKDARRMCDGCPVKQKCLDWALQWDRDHPDYYDRLQGIWGGTNEADRKSLLKGEKDAA